MHTFESSPTIEGAESTYVDESLFRGCVLEGRWDYVLTAYKNNRHFHNIKINESRGTALHVAVNDGRVELVNTLVGAILSHEGSQVLRDDSALKTTNERGDTPLHLDASRGFIGMCMCLIGESGERQDLIKLENNDLAIIIIHCYPGLVDTRNKDGATPLKVLASKPSAFKSGINLPWRKQILYYGILVEHLHPEKAIKSYMSKVEKCGDNELKVNIQSESSEAKKAQFFVEKQYATSVRFLKSAVRLSFKFLSILGLGVTTRDLIAIKKIRQKHRWSRQLLNIFMARPYESYMGNTGGRPFEKYGLDNFEELVPQQQLHMVGGGVSTSPEENNRVESAGKIEEKETFVIVAKAAIIELVNELHNKIPRTLHNTTTPEMENMLVVPMKNIKILKQGEYHVDIKETAFLAAAKNGIVEIVVALQNIIPSAVHETNSNNENVLLVAVKNRQTKVVEVLKNHLDKELFDSLILEVDNRDNTVLHLAAGTTSNTERTWQIAGAAMQMMWDIKWFQYIRDLLREHYDLRLNQDGETAEDILTNNLRHRVNQSSEWLKETSSRCSAVAALIAGVSFTAATTVPGGTEKGEPLLVGQPAFDAFAIA